LEFDWIWKSVLIVLAGTVLLRFAGRKSISQMTLPQTVIMIGIGSLLIQPVAGKNIWVTIGVGGVLVGTLIVMEYGQVKGNIFEKLITGNSKPLIENGIINEKNLLKVRLTVDQLEMNLRLQNVSNITDVQYATLEPNGQIGFILKQEAMPVTKKEFQQLLDMLQQSTMFQANLVQVNEQIEAIKKQIEKAGLEDNLFTEVVNKSHDKQGPDHLQ
jgi:uncharacterized membrane protein YcaP (DUF421 family)